MGINDWYVNDTGYLVPKVLRLMDYWNVHAITSGVIDLAWGLVKASAESGSADDLTTINGGATGNLIILKADTGDTITVKHNTGNILCPNDEDFILTASSGNILALMYDYEDFKWKPLAVSAAAAPATPTFDGVQLYSEVDYSRSSTAYFYFPWTAETFDTDSYWSNAASTKIYLNKIGYYRFSGYMTCGNVSTTADFRIRLIINSDDADASRFADYSEKATNVFHKIDFDVVYYNDTEGDYLEVQVGSTDSSYYILLGITQTRLDVQYLGE